MVRFKNRYITVEVNPLGQAGSGSLDIGGLALHEAVVDAVQKVHGDFGRAALSSGLTTKYCNAYTRVAVLRARHGPHRILASSLPFVTHVSDRPVTLHTLYTGATLKHCYIFLQRHQRAALDHVWSSLRTADERDAMERAVMDLSVLENFQLKKEQHEAERKAASI